MKLREILLEFRADIVKTLCQENPKSKQAFKNYR